MEQSVNGIRDAFYRDLAAGYQREGERSFLYGYFWQENARELWKNLFPDAPASQGPKDRHQLEGQLRQALEKLPEWGRSLLLRKPPEGSRKERRDLWQELTLNDAGYQAGLITDTDYYQWLTAYLSARDIYYKDSVPWDPEGSQWLRPLLQAGLGRQIQGVLSKAQTERGLKALRRLLREEQAAGKAEAAGRLHELTLQDPQAGQAGDYLPWLTGRLKQAALHNKIKTWLQDSGYPLRMEGISGAAPKGPRKQDFSMRLFDAYCDSPSGYDFMPRGLSGWRMSGQEFCILDADQLEPLLALLNARGTPNDNPYFYLPLAVHLQSGCVFFLAGKAIYEEVYDGAVKGKREAFYRETPLFCFDYLRLNDGFWEAGLDAARSPFRLLPTFHENMGKNYLTVLNDFKRYCVVGAKSVITSVRGFNQSAPAGTPSPFLWAFDPSEEPKPPEPSKDGRDAFYRTWNHARQGPGGAMV